MIINDGVGDYIEVDDKTYKKLLDIIYRLGTP